MEAAATDAVLFIVSQHHNEDKIPRCRQFCACRSTQNPMRINKERALGAKQFNQRQLFSTSFNKSFDLFRDLSKLHDSVKSMI
jgi:hypothetical protein